jgi:hypothetical protein
MLKVGLKKNGQIEEFKPFFFTQASSVKIGFKKALFTHQKMNGNIHFYNQERELCATIARVFFSFSMLIANNSTTKIKSSKS